jgi:hypothetical protein
MPRISWVTQPLRTSCSSHPWNQYSVSIKGHDHSSHAVRNWGRTLLSYHFFWGGRLRRPVGGELYHIHLVCIALPKHLVVIRNLNPLVHAWSREVRDSRPTERQRFSDRVRHRGVSCHMNRRWSNLTTRPECVQLSVFLEFGTQSFPSPLSLDCTATHYWYNIHHDVDNSPTAACSWPPDLCEELRCVERHICVHLI